MRWILWQLLQVLDILQVNTLAAEKLYALAGDWAGLGPDTLLFDICCGTGTIGLTLAHRVGMVRLTTSILSVRSCCFQMHFVVYELI